MSKRLNDLLEHARDLFRGESNPVASREALIDTGKRVIANLIRENLDKNRKAKSKKGISDWTFKKDIAGIPVKTIDRLTYGNIKLKGILVFDKATVPIIAESIDVAVWLGHPAHQSIGCECKGGHVTGWIPDGSKIAIVVQSQFRPLAEGSHNSRGQP